MRAMTVPFRVLETAEAQGGRVALFWEEAETSFAALWERSASVSGGLRKLGVRPGDRVAVGLANSPELVHAAVGVLAAGAVLVPLNPAYNGAEAAYVIKDSGARVVVTHREQARDLEASSVAKGRTFVDDVASLASGLRDRAAAKAEDPALIVYTSGTTGLPKGAVLSHRALVANLDAVAAAWRWTAADRLLLTLPCFHLHGLALGMLGSLLVGSQIVLRPRFVAETTPLDCARHRITLFFGVPTMYNRLVGLPDELLRQHDLSAMRLWVSGSAPLTVSTFQRFEQRFGHHILERFGMSEGGFMISAPLAGPRRPGVVGRPLPGIEIRLVDPDAADQGDLQDVPDGEPGEIVIRGPNLFSGYWNRPAETARAFVAGFFRSGDLAAREPDGMLRITGRISLDIIKTRGFKVSAVEIENQLQAHPEVEEVAVIGLPDSDQGERVVAAVSQARGGKITPDELRDFVRARLAPHKVPAAIVFVDEIPRTGPGKFDKRRLVEKIRLAGTGMG